MDFEKELSEIYPWILKVARKFCCSMQDAEDLAGDTVYKLLVIVINLIVLNHFNRGALL